MEISLKRGDSLSATERADLKALTRAVYPPEVIADDPEDAVEWTGTPWSVLVWDDQDRLVSHVGGLTRQETLDAKPVLLGGIGGVKTAPSARNRGYARAALERATTFLIEDCGVDFLLLVCQPSLLNLHTLWLAPIPWRSLRGTALRKNSVHRQQDDDPQRSSPSTS